MSERIEIAIDLELLTLGDIEEIEDAIGVETLREVFKGNVSAKAMVHLAHIMKRKSDPGFTLDQARRLPLTAFTLDGADPKGDGSASAGSESSPLSASPPE